MVHHLVGIVSWKERGSGTGISPGQKYSMLGTGSHQQEGEDLMCWRKGDSWNGALEEARGTGTGTAVGEPGQSIRGNGQGGRACRCVALQVGFVEVLLQLPQLRREVGTGSRE